MDARMTKRYAAMLVAGATGLATALTGCGGSEPSKTVGSSTTSTSGATAPATGVMPATVDVNSATEVAAVLKALGVETPATEPLGTDRGSGADGVAFPTWPAGEVRKAGLSTYRIDATGSYADDGTLKFVKGGKTLYEAAFKPTREQTEAGIPAAVTESLKVGDTVTWGVWFANKKVKPVTVSFTVVDKPQVTKSEAKFYADKSLDPVVRSLAMGQMLQNYRLYSEAVSVYAGVLAADGRISSVYKPIAESLASLKMKDTPLFDLAKSRMVSVAGSAVRPTSAGEGLSKGGGPQPVAPHTSGAVPPPVVTPPADATPAAPAPAPDDGGLAGPVPAPTPSVVAPNPSRPGDAPTTNPDLPTAPPVPGTSGPASGAPDHGPSHPNAPTPPRPTPITPPRPTLPTPPRPTGAPSVPALPPGEQGPAEPVPTPSVPPDAEPTPTPTLPPPPAVKPVNPEPIPGNTMPKEVDELGKKAAEEAAAKAAEAAKKAAEEAAEEAKKAAEKAAMNP